MNVHKAFFSPVGWLENTGSPRDRKFNLHIIDKVRSPHSISVADLDGDGKMEVIVGEHDPFKPYRSQSRLFAYKQADAQGITWSRFPIDNRFEHHDGAKAVELSPGRLADPKPRLGWSQPTFISGSGPAKIPLKTDRQPVSAQRSQRGDGDSGDDDATGDGDTAVHKQTP